MTDAFVIFDLALAAGILWMGWVSLSSADAFRAVVAFICFGLLISLAWVRLNAPDVALAEAAVGAGVTGALFLRSIGLMRRPATPEAASGWLKACAGILAAGIAIVVGIALVRLPGGVGGYDALAAAGLGVSGVTNPVTAVLLNYRSFDTLLEVMVLIAALVAVIMIGPRQDYVQQCLGPLFAPFAAVVVPLSIVVAGYLLWLGSSAPGGAFQAGAVLGAGLSILLMGRVYTPASGHAAALRWLAIGGLVVFAGAGILSLALTGGILQYPEGWDKVWIVTIEAALTVSIGVVLAALFHGGLPKGERE